MGIFFFEKPTSHSCFLGTLWYPNEYHRKNLKTSDRFLQSVLPLDRGILKVSSPRLRLRQALSLGMPPLLGHYHLTQNNQKSLLSFIIESRGLGFKDLQCAMKSVCWSSSSWHCKLMTLQTDERRAIPQSLHTPGGKKYNLCIFFPFQLRLYDDDDAADDGAVQI